MTALAAPSASICPAEDVVLAVAGGLVQLAFEVDELGFEGFELKALAIGRHPRLLQLFLLGGDFVFRIGDDLVANLELPGTAGEIVPDVLECWM